tara:strand:+ start:368 stop:808 length:441 start_codon:yes stop_codon:yes gene_type:complete
MKVKVSQTVDFEKIPEFAVGVLSDEWDSQQFLMEDIMSNVRANMEILSNLRKLQEIFANLQIAANDAIAIMEDHKNLSQQLQQKEMVEREQQQQNQLKEMRSSLEKEIKEELEKEQENLQPTEGCEDCSCDKKSSTKKLPFVPYED